MDGSKGRALRTKVVATVGPATASPEGIEAIVRAGVNVVRVNFAHGTPETHRNVVGWVRAAAERLDVPVAILADLAGPKIRIGDLPAPVELAEGAHVELVPEEELDAGGPGNAADAGGPDSPDSPEDVVALPSTYAGLAADVEPGHRILLDDGRLELRVTGTRGVRVRAEVVRGGTLRSSKGLNLPGVRLSAPALTEKDREDLALATELDVDYVGLSFVQSPRDVDTVRSLLPDGLLVVAKIEKEVALRRLEEILDRADAVMVARGDLGVELPFQQVPVAQKQIIQRANLYGRPVITATQMLESMIEEQRPTRAEASDVANALFDGTDAVMLSGETAVGKHPLDAVRAMVSIGREIESTASFGEGPKYDVPIENRFRAGATPTEHAIAAATAEAVELLGAPAIVTLTRSGFTPRLVSSYRPPVPILGVTQDPRVFRQLALVWGVIPVLCQLDGDPDYDAVLRCARRYLLQHGMAREGDRLVVTAGVPFFAVAGTTNMLRVEAL